VPSCSPATGARVVYCSLRPRWIARAPRYVLLRAPRAGYRRGPRV